MPLTRRSLLKSLSLTTAATALGLEVVAPEPHKRVWQVHRNAPVRSGTLVRELHAWSIARSDALREHIDAHRRSFAERVELFEELLRADMIDRDHAAHLLMHGQAYDPAWDMPGAVDAPTVTIEVRAADVPDAPLFGISAGNHSAYRASFAEPLTMKQAVRMYFEREGRLATITPGAKG